MRVLFEQARLDQVDEYLETAHVEFTIRLDSGDCVYVQAHDSGIGRYFVVSRVSFFGSQQEEDEDILEEYSTSPNGSEKEHSLEFIDFLDNWNEQREQMDEAPYMSSMFAMFFEMEETMLDTLLTEIEEEQQLG